MSPSDALPTTVRRLLGASVRLLVRADEAAVRATETTERLRATAALGTGLLPLPRRPYDEL
jgi:hypothetical protein